MKLAQAMLQRIYKIVHPPRRFSPNQVDQEGLWIVCLATNAAVLSTILVVFFSIWALLSTPSDEVAAMSTSAPEIEDSEDQWCTYRRVVGCLVAIVAGCAFGCGLDSDRPLPRALLLLL